MSSNLRGAKVWCAAAFDGFYSQMATEVGTWHVPQDNVAPGER
jgi:hypothetical protein